MLKHIHATSAAQLIKQPQSEGTLAPAKSSYRKPELVSYGLVRNLTQAGSRGGVENIGMGMMGMGVPMGMMGMG